MLGLVLLPNPFAGSNWSALSCGTCWWKYHGNPRLAPPRPGTRPTRLVQATPSRLIAGGSSILLVRHLTPSASQRWLLALPFLVLTSISTVLQCRTHILPEFYNLLQLTTYSPCLDRNSPALSPTLPLCSRALGESGRQHSAISVKAPTIKPSIIIDYEL